MRKKAQRKIKAQFKAATGSEVAGMTVIGSEEGVVAYVPSSWRRLKKSYIRSR